MVRYCYGRRKGWYGMLSMRADEVVAGDRLADWGTGRTVAWEVDLAERADDRVRLRCYGVRLGGGRGVAQDFFPLPNDVVMVVYRP